MKAALLKGSNQVIIDDIPVPKISDDEVLLEIKYCGICGSDVCSVRDATLLPPGTYMGHEFSGVIAEIGKNVGGTWKVGDRVTCNPLYMCGECWGCKHGRYSICQYAAAKGIGTASGIEYQGAFAKYVRVPIPGKRLHHLPDELSFEEGALVEACATSLHPVRVSAFRPRDSAMVLGAGPIGLGVIAHLKSAGAGLIIATEVNGKRIELAEKFGADYVFNPQEFSDLKAKVLELTNGEGIDVVFMHAPVSTVFEHASDFLRIGGQIILHGIITEKVPILPIDWAMNEWQLQGLMGYYADEFPMAIEYLRKKLPYKEMITSKIKLGDIVNEGFDRLLTPDHSEVKILVSPE